MSMSTTTGWTDVAGLEAAKKTLKEIVVLPFMRPYATFCDFSSSETYLMTFSLQ